MSAHDPAPLILGVSGLRGIVGQSLTPELAVRYAQTFARWLDQQTLSRGEVLVVRDGRAGGEMLEHAAIAGLLAEGCVVSPGGVAMTPSAAAAVDQHDLDGAIIITASHNPQEWNGLKLLVRRRTPDGPIAPDACAPDAANAEAIVDRFRALGALPIPGNATPAPTVAPGSISPERIDATRAHAAAVAWALEETIPGARDAIAAAAVRVVVDSVNSSGALGVPALFAHDALPVHAIQLFGDPSGRFPHTPEPTRENLSGDGGLCGAVPALGALAGFAQDPDADRLAIIDETGAYIGEEYTLVLCAHALLAAAQDYEDDRRAPVLVTNLSTSRMLDDVARAFGGRVVRTPVGEANVVSVMKSLRDAGERVVLGGEGNGGVIWPEVSYVRDSLSSMALVLAHAARTGRSVSAMVRDINAMGAGGAGYAIEKRKAPVASKAAAKPAVDAVRDHFAQDPEARIDTQDGVRVDFDREGSWLHVRPSNTEPILRLIAEARTTDAANDLLARAERAIPRA